MADKNLVTDYGADPTGVANSSPALESWLAFGQAAGPTPVSLEIPAGTYLFTGTRTIADGIYDATVYATGATVNHLGFGNYGCLQDSKVKSSRIQTVSAGATSVTLVTAGEASRFTVGLWILVTGLSFQTPLGYPPNFRYFEYRQVTGISGGVISFSDPLENAYLSTWPLTDPSAVNSCDLAGPATIYALTAAFGGQHTVYGLTCTFASVSDFGSGGTRSMTIDGCSFVAGPSPTMSKSWVFRNCTFSAGTEIDKCIDYLEYDNCTISAGNLESQSSSTNLMVIKNGSVMPTVAGTPTNFIIENSTITEATEHGLIIGPTQYGHSNSVVITDSSIASTRWAVGGINSIGPTVMSFASGTFSIAYSDGNYSKTVAWAIPGLHYVFAYYAGGNPVIVDDLSQTTTFTITDVRGDATHIYVDTNIAGALPTPTFLGGNPASHLISYGAETIQQCDSGPADATPFAYTIIPCEEAPPVVLMPQACM